MKMGIVINALAGQNIPVIESRGIAGQVPFADHGRLVTGFLQLLGNVIALGIDTVVERIDAVFMAVLAS